MTSSPHVSAALHVSSARMDAARAAAGERAIAAALASGATAEQAASRGARVRLAIDFAADAVRRVLAGDDHGAVACIENAASFAKPRI